MKKLIFGLGCIIGTIAAIAQPGRLDSSFGESGKVVYNYSSQFSNLSVLKNDKIIAVAQSILTQYFPDGSLDSSFGINGAVITSDHLYSGNIAVQPDGKIVTAGSKTVFSSPSAIIMRFLPDGTVDSTFASNGVFFDSLMSNQVFGDVAVQPDGKIIALGMFGEPNFFSYPMLVRLNEDGSPDNSFGNRGERKYFLESNYPVCMALQTDGRIVTGGNNGSYGSSGLQFVLTRYKADGDIDSSFGINGVVVTDFDQDGEFIQDIVIQPDGKIVAAGGAHEYSFSGRKAYMAVARYNFDGSLDESFGLGGKTKAAFDQIFSQANAITLQQNGKIVVAGVAATTLTGDFALARFLENGILDSSFGTDGKIATIIEETGDEAKGIGIQKDGKIIVGGRARTVDNVYETQLSRYYGDPVNQHPLITKIKRWIKNHILHFQDNNPEAEYYVIEQSNNGVRGFKEVARIKAESLKPKAERKITGLYSYIIPPTGNHSQSPVEKRSSTA